MNVKLTIENQSEISELSIRMGLGFQAVCAKEQTGIEFDCREADCGICSIKIISGAENLSPKTIAEDDFLKAMKADPDERLACQVRILGPVRIALNYL
jgi:ferredoxin